VRLTFIFIFLASYAFGQYDHISVYPDLEGDELSSNLVDDYKPNQLMRLSMVRDTLYGKVHFHDDSVRCVYTGLAKYLDLTEDPSTFLFQDGGNSDLNLEHCYPQAKGAGFGNARGDMHHLFPTRVPVNTARGNDAFMEIEDSETEEWFYKEETLESPPTSMRDSYSEDIPEGFEPREDFKGNVARAYFYFYTMYRDQADSEDPDYFDLQVETLCDWHEADPVDSLEWVRTFLIANYQEDKPNPFVLDCRLARLYCSSISEACQTVNTEEIGEASFSLSKSTYHPNERLVFASSISKDNTMAISSLDGLLISQTLVSSLRAPEMPGMYILSGDLNGQLVSIKFLVR